MRKISLLFLVIIPTLLLAACSKSDKQDEIDPPAPQPTEKYEKIEYTQSDKVIVNPERGFYTHRQYATDDTNALTAQFVKGYRDQGVSLILTIYYMMDFRDKLISADYLQRIRTNMLALREGGSKSVLRFAYTHSESQKPWDAPWNLTEQHIGQLKPILEEFSDVICVLEAGFVGVWGEWYYTDNYNYQPSQNIEEYTPRRQVLDALLKALPKERMVSVRYPAAKLFTMGLAYTDTITRQKAYNESDISRVSFHNDCFLADSDDRGTFGGNRNYRKYWEWESKYVAMGGETCAKSTYSTCDNAVVDLAKYHWSYINTDYHPAVIGQWGQEYCMDEIKKRLGYRFVLTEGVFSKTGQIGNPFEIDLQLQNIGWAAPFNPRDVEIIFVAKNDKSNKYKIKLKDDPRFWFSGDKVSIKSKFALPESMPTGDYDIFLNLPDPKPTIASRPEYSIQLANEGIWDNERGYNKLYSATVLKASSKEDFSGESLKKF